MRAHLGPMCMRDTHRLCRWMRVPESRTYGGGEATSPIVGSSDKDRHGVTRHYRNYEVAVEVPAFD